MLAGSESMQLSTYIHDPPNCAIIPGAYSLLRDRLILPPNSNACQPEILGYAEGLQKASQVFSSSEEKPKANKDADAMLSYKQTIQ